MTISETDPHGTGQHEAGAKMDEGKNRLAMVLGGFKGALKEVGRVGTFGANKYSDYGWLSVPDGYNRYSDALLRHFFTDEEIDEDSSMLHDAQVAWNALARLEFKLRERDGRQREETFTPGEVTIIGSSGPVIHAVSSEETSG